MATNSFSRRSFLKASSIFGISITPAVKPLAKLFDMQEGDIGKMIDFGFRLTKPENLLSLEFYFINVAFKKGCIFSKSRLLSYFGQAQSFMVVRLPQQHIAEQSYDAATQIDDCKFDDTPPEPDWIAKVCISGFSYLVFRLVPDPEKKLKITLNETELLDWNDEKKYQLVIRQNLNESLFNIKFSDDWGGKFYENNYPLSYGRMTGGKYKFNPERFPKAYGSPITAIEAPWRLMVSPQLADPRQFRYKWLFTKPTRPGDPVSELWIATLTVEARPVILPPTGATGDDRTLVRNNQPFSPLKLMFIGSPDHPKPFKTTDIYFTKKTTKADVKILPVAQNRFDLVELYIKYKLLAQVGNISFSQLGISAFIEFSNTRIADTLKREPKIELYSYKHLISFGRDEGVEVVRLILDKESGLKMLYIKTTRRRTKGGISYLDYREYIKPLELEKDYTGHEDAEGLSKFKAPFKKIKFLEVEPKRMCSLNQSRYGDNAKLETITKIVGNTRSEEIQGIFYPLTYDPDTQSITYLTFLVEITDWHDQQHRINKKIQAITFGTNDLLTSGRWELRTIDDFFDGIAEVNPTSATAIDQKSRNIDASFTALLNDVRNLAGTQPALPQQSQQVPQQQTQTQPIARAFFDNTVSQLIELKNSIPTGRINELLNTKKNALSDLLKTKEIQFRNAIQAKINMITLDLTSYKEKVKGQIAEIQKRSTEAEKKLSDLTKNIDSEIEDATKYMEERLDVLKKKIGPIEKLLGKFKPVNEAMADAADDLKKARKALATEQAQQRPNQAEIERLQKRINKLLLYIDDYDKKFKDLVLQYATQLSQQGQSGVTDLDKLVKNLDRKKADFADELKTLRAQITEKTKAINNKYTAVEKDLKEQKDKITKELDDLKLLYEKNLGKITEQVKASSLLYVLENANDWFGGLKVKLDQVYQDFVEKVSKGFEEFLADEVDTQVNEVTLEIVNLKRLISAIPIVEVNGQPLIGIDGNPLKIDLGLILAGDIDGLISEVKLVFFDFAYRYLRPLKDFETDLNAQLAEFKSRFKTKVLNELNALNHNTNLIKNAIYTYRSKIGYAVNQIKDTIDDINGDLSALETDFFVLKGEIKSIIDDKSKNKIIDFFHHYASLPQMQYAQVYISSLSKLVNQETAVAISYANDYINSQKDLYNLNVEKNVSKVFAEIKEYSKIQIKGQLRNLSEHFGGFINPEIAVDFLSYLRDPKKIEQKLIDQLPADVKKELEAAQKAVEDGDYDE